MPWGPDALLVSAFNAAILSRIKPFIQPRLGSSCVINAATEVQISRGLKYEDRLRTCTQKGERVRVLYCILQPDWKRIRQRRMGSAIIESINLFTLGPITEHYSRWRLACQPLDQKERY
jgi:hypothetical protein